MVDATDDLSKNYEDTCGWWYQRKTVDTKFGLKRLIDFDWAGNGEEKAHPDKRIELEKTWTEGNIECL